MFLTLTDTLTAVRHIQIYSQTPIPAEGHTHKKSRIHTFETQIQFSQHCIDINTRHTDKHIYIFFLTPTKESQTLTKGLKIGSEVISALFQASLEAISLATSNRLIFITRLYYWECSASLPLHSMEGITLYESEQDLSSLCHLLHMSLNYLSSHKASSQKPITL